MILGGESCANRLPLAHLRITYLDQIVYSFRLFSLEDIEADFFTPSLRFSRKVFNTNDLKAKSFVK